MSQEWSRVVSAEVKEVYMILQGIQTHCSQLTSQNPKTVKSHLSLTLMRVKLVTFSALIILGIGSGASIIVFIFEHIFVKYFV